MLRENFPSVNIKAFTAVELCHFAKISSRPLSEIITDLKNAGLDALPGGGTIQKTNLASILNQLTAKHPPSTHSKDREKPFHEYYLIFPIQVLEQ